MRRPGPALLHRSARRGSRPAAGNTPPTCADGGTAPASPGGPRAASAGGTSPRPWRGGSGDPPRSGLRGVGPPGGRRRLGVAALAVLAAAAGAGPLAPPAGAAGPPGPTLPPLMTPETAAAVDKGLAYLVRVQQPDGHFEAYGYGGSYPAVMTSLAGLAMLAQGSTPEEGPYAATVKRSLQYLLRLADPAVNRDGLLAGPGSEGRSMYGHGFSMLFLAQCYGMEPSAALEPRIRDALERGAALTARAQSPLGGWIYTPTSGGDEGSVTVTQLQALRACRNAGLKVPKDTIDRAVGYLRMCQNEDGGISYSAQNRGSSRPAISAAAIACFYAAGLYDRQTGGRGVEAEMVERLVRYVRGSVGGGAGGEGHYFYTHFYMAQAMYQRGGRDWETYYPDIARRLLAMQAADGSWQGDGVGPTYGTAIACVILQLPYGYLPICQR